MERKNSKPPPLMMIIPEMERKPRWNSTSSPSLSGKNTMWPPQSHNTCIPASLTDFSKHLCWSAAFVIWEMSNTDALTKAVTGSRTADSMTHALCFYMNNMSTSSWLRRTEKTPSITSCCSEKKRRQARRDCKNMPSLCERRNSGQSKRPKWAERNLKN